MIIVYVFEICKRIVLHTSKNITFNMILKIILFIAFLLLIQDVNCQEFMLWEDKLFVFQELIKNQDYKF